MEPKEASDQRLVAEYRAAQAACIEAERAVCEAQDARREAREELEATREALAEHFDLELHD
jgi:hypothetical protein